jgi:protein-disulfide isomerase
MSVLLLASILAGCQDRSTASSSASVPPGPPPAAATAPAASTSGDAVVASWNGGSLTYAELTKDIAGQLTKLQADYLTERYDTESQAMDDKVNQQILELEAKKRGLASGDALLAEEVEKKVAAPTEAEVQEAWGVLQRKFRGKALEDVRGDVEKAVTQKKRGERYQVYIKELRATYGVTTQLPYPDLPRFMVSTDDDPVLGPDTAPVTIIQFADYQCPYCGKAQETMDEVMKKYDGKVKLVFRDFPLSFHENAQPAAVAANCAIPQGKFWPIHDAIMKDQRALTDADLQRLAQENGLDTTKWESCRKDPTLKDEIAKDEKDGSEVGVTGTPAFFINGIFLNGAQPFEKFSAIIDSELNKKG